MTLDMSCNAILLLLLLLFLKGGGSMKMFKNVKVALASFHCSVHDP